MDDEEQHQRDAEQQRDYPQQPLDQPAPVHVILQPAVETYGVMLVGLGVKP